VGRTSCLLLGLFAIALLSLLAPGASALPDLRVSVSAASNITDNGAVPITVTLSNVGDATAGNASVALAIDGNPTDPPLEFPSLAAGGSSTQTPSFVLSCGRHALRAEADPANVVVEAVESDNNESGTAAVLPLANFTFVLSGELGAFKLTLNASSSRGCAPLAFAWTVSAVGDFAGEQITFDAPAGTLAVNLTAASLADATLASRASRAVPVPNHPPNVQASAPFPAISTGVPTALAVYASDPDGQVAGFQVDLGDGNKTESLANASFHRYAQPGSYLITVRATDNLGAVNETVVVLLVLNRPPDARPDTPYVYVEVGQKVTLDASASRDPEGGPLTFVWQFGDGGTANGLSAVHTYGAPGVYAATLNVTDERGASSVVGVRVTVLSASRGATDTGGLLTAGFLAFLAVVVVVYVVTVRRQAANAPPAAAPPEKHPRE
jgi:PKD repeat protein